MPKKNQNRKLSPFKVGQLVTVSDPEPTYRVMFSTRDGWGNFEQLLENPSKVMILDDEYEEWYLGQGTSNWVIKVLSPLGPGWVFAHNVKKDEK